MSKFRTLQLENINKQPFHNKAAACRQSCILLHLMMYSHAETYPLFASKCILSPSSICFAVSTQAYSVGSLENKYFQ